MIIKCCPETIEKGSCPGRTTPLISETSVTWLLQNNFVGKLFAFLDNRDEHYSAGCGLQVDLFVIDPVEVRHLVAEYFPS